MHEIIGIITASNWSRTVYITKKTVSGDKNSDLLKSFLADYIYFALPAFVQYVQMYLDSAPYFNTKVEVWWAAKLLCSDRFK